MNKLLTTLLLLTLCTHSLKALEPLHIQGEQVQILSTFDSVTFLTSYSPAGEPLWEIRFHSDVISWKTEQENLFVLSKAKQGNAYFLTCIETASGKFLWERTISAPDAVVPPPDSSM